MTLDEKIGQLFYFFFYGEDFNDQVERIISQYHGGNFIYYTWANEIKSPARVSELSKNIQKQCLLKNKLPALIAIDQEGGVVSRLTGEFPTFPGGQELIAKKDPNYVREIAFEMASTLKNVGINLNFAPVVDINLDASSFISKRTLGDTPEEVITHATAFIEGLKRGCVFSTLKHFPGHGSANLDSHFELPEISAKLEELEKRDLRPFQALKDKCDAIMVAHLFLPKIDPRFPSTFSRLIIQSILKEKMNFQGVVIADSIVMRACAHLQNTLEETIESVAEASIQTFIAGSDQIILGRAEWAKFHNHLSEEANLQLIEGVLKRFKKAVMEGRITEDRLNEALERILRLKSKINSG